MVEQSTQLPYQQLKDEYERLQLLYHALLQLTGNLSVQQVLELLLQQTVSSTGAQRGCVLLIDNLERLQIQRYDQQLSVGTPTSFTTRVLHEGLAGWVLRQQQEALIPDTTLDPRWLSNPEAAEPARSVLALPLQLSPQLRGVLTLLHDQPRMFDQSQLQRVTLIARHAVLATQNAQLLATISQERRKFGAAMNSMDEGLLLVDDQGQLSFANPQVLSLLNLQPPLPPTLAELSAPLAAIFERALQLQQNLRTEIALPGPPALDLAVHIGHTPLQQDQERWWTIVLRDITPLKEYDRLKTRFVANASHELRTPLANIKLYATLARQGRPERRDSYLETITHEVSWLEALVEDLLTLSRIDSGTLRGQPGRIAVAALVEELASTYRPLAEARQLKLHTAMQNLEALVAFDQDHLCRVIINLLSNALKFTAPGGNITIRTGQASRQGRLWVTLSVSDTGSGIDEADLPHLFKRFYRSQQAQATGSGLGLAIVHELLNLWGSEITVESKVGAGSTFTCWLPPAGPDHTQL